jgi:ABC-type uncharacterized transport system substrate-binding protein
MRRSRFWQIVGFSILSLLTWAWFITSDTSLRTPPVSSTNPTQTRTVDHSSPPRRILFVNSYHAGYPWSDGILDAFVGALELEPRQDPGFWDNADFVLHVFYMDSKRHPSEESKTAAAKHAENLIADWKPDIVVTSDDNAVKYLVVSLVKSSSLPIVFCGINWDASEYALPRSQVTGMIEVQPIKHIMETLEPFARGTKIGFLKGKDFSTAKEADAFEKFLGRPLHRRLVIDFEEWFTAYQEMQQDCDMLLIGNSASIEGWDGLRAKQLIATATRIPTGTWDAWMREYALVTFSTVPAEQGAWSAEAVRAILAGQSPAETPITQNHKAKIYRNMAIAKQLEIVFPMEFIRRSWAVERTRPL